MKAPQLLKENEFESVIDGKETALFTLKNANGMLAQLTNFGARLVALWVQGQDKMFRDVALGFSSINAYNNATEQYHGATVGRYANRIANGKFKLDGVPYTLACNNDSNHLHGGIKGFHKVVWDTELLARNAIKFSYVSIDGEEGYPGKLLVDVIYELTDNNELSIKYSAISDQKTVVNLTHHTYFNLSGEGHGNIEDHSLLINSDFFTPVKSGSIPLGTIQSLDDSPLDFRSMHPMLSRIEREDEQLKIGLGYDHNYVLRDFDKTSCDARVEDSKSGLIMEVFTDQPGIQFYTANFLDGSDIGKSGKSYVKRSAFCLETQAFPDSPNHDTFPSTVLDRGEKYETKTVYRFL